MMRFWHPRRGSDSSGGAGPGASPRNTNRQNRLSWSSNSSSHGLFRFRNSSSSQNATRSRRRSSVSRQMTSLSASSVKGASQPNSELQRLSRRLYAERVTDREDFASVWEASLVPYLAVNLRRCCGAEFSVDVHNFPEKVKVKDDSREEVGVWDGVAEGGQSAEPQEPIPRVIYITTSRTLSLGQERDIRDHILSAIPSRFEPTHVEFLQGSVKNSMFTHWRGGDGDGDDDSDPSGSRLNDIDDTAHPPKNTVFCNVPMIGSSIGPNRTSDTAATLGGIIQMAKGLNNKQLYAMSAFHPFEDCLSSGDMRVCHPARRDYKLNRRQDDTADRPYPVGAMVIFSGLSQMRASQTFEGTRRPGRVGMDWALIGPVVEESQNIVPVRMLDGQSPVVQKMDAVHGNVAVDTLARTTRYLVGWTSDVPGLQWIRGVERREWTVRGCAAAKCRREGGVHGKERFEEGPSAKEWLNGGVGLKGDSGAWLMRRSDHAVIGMVWGRNQERVRPGESAGTRMAYFTPMLDIRDDIRQRYPEWEVTLPRIPIGDGHGEGRQSSNGYI